MFRRRGIFLYSFGLVFMSIYISMFFGEKGKSSITEWVGFILILLFSAVICEFGRIGGGFEDDKTKKLLRAIVASYTFMSLIAFFFLNIKIDT